mgnify:CR=1 FL=1
MERSRIPLQNMEVYVRGITVLSVIFFFFPSFFFFLPTVWVCFNSFSLILDFFDFCAPVHALRQYRENLQILKNIAKYIDIWIISHLFRLIGGRKNWISTPRWCQNRSRIFLGWFWNPLTICEQSCFFSIFGSCFLFWLYLFSKFIPILAFLFWSGHIWVPCKDGLVERN